MRHRRRGRTLGRNPSHQRAMLRNLASSLFLTEDDLQDEDNEPKVKGRVVTTLQKAKEVRPLVERCITIARKGLIAMQDAEQYAVDADRHSEPWRAWRQSEKWNQWAQAMAPAVTARRRVLQLLGNKNAVRVLFDEVAPRFADRPGGYTRIVRLAKPRLGDAGTRAFIEFVGVRDRVSQRSVAPAFDDAAAEDEVSSQPEAVATEPEATKPEATTEEE